MLGVNSADVCCRRRAIRRRWVLYAAGFLFWRQKKRHRKRLWVGPEIESRKKEDDYHLLVQDIRQKRVDKFMTYFRMTPEIFYKILGYIKSSITKITTNMRTPISAEERLCVTLQYLVSGGTYSALAMKYGMSTGIVSRIVPETCDAIWTALQPIVMPAPTKEKWKELAKQFEGRYQFPNCLGAIAGRHIQIRTPNNSGSMFYNYNNTSSIILLATVDADCKFVAVDVGGHGRYVDRQILAQSKFGTELLSGQLDLPENKILPGQSKPVPHIFVADESFPLQHNLLLPFPASCLHDHAKCVFNDRLSQARDSAEMALIILASRYKALHGRLDMSPGHACSIVKACTVLHNLLHDEKLDDNCCATMGEGASTFELLRLQKIEKRDNDDSQRSCSVH